MSAPRQFADLNQVALPPQPLHLAIGMFDGLHRGHQSVINAALAGARRNGGLAGVLTFWPHPSVLFRPTAPTQMLMSPEMKRAVLGRLGLDFIIEQNFSPALAQIAAEDFLPYLQRSLPQLAAIYVGENWRFGRERRGDVGQLIAAAKQVGLSVFSAPRLNHEGEPISSSRIRGLLSQGEIAAANALLGYVYFADGMVQPGRQLGRQLGFPTLNIAWVPELQPRLGVYAVKVTLPSGQVVNGVANYGLRPTVGLATAPLLEVHLLEATTADAGDYLAVSWLQYLRPEQKFAGVDALRAQIALDRQKAIDFFGQ